MVGFSSQTLIVHPSSDCPEAFSLLQKVKFQVPSFKKKVLNDRAQTKNCISSLKKRQVLVDPLHKDQFFTLRSSWDCSQVWDIQEENLGE